MRSAVAPPLRHAAQPSVMSRLTSRTPARRLQLPTQPLIRPRAVGTSTSCGCRTFPRRARNSLQLSRRRRLSARTRSGSSRAKTRADNPHVRTHADNRLARIRAANLRARIPGVSLRARTRAASPSAPSRSVGPRSSATGPTRPRRTARPRATGREAGTARWTGTSPTRPVCRRRTGQSPADGIAR